MRVKKIIALTLALLMICLEVFAFEPVSEAKEDLGYIPSMFLKQGRESSRTVRYAPWLVNYALQTEAESAAVNGGEGFQQISDIAISPVDNNLMLFGTDTCGIWRSTDGGQNWISVNDGVNCWGVHDIIFHPTDKNIAYMIQGAANSSVSSNQIQARTDLDGFYKSVDGGKSWRQVLDVNIRASVGVNRLIAFDSSGNLYLLTAEGLLRSADSGESWISLFDFREKLGIGDLVNSDLCIRENTIVFTNSDGLFASTDLGRTWNRKNIGASEGASAYGVDIDPENSSHWLACFGSPYNEVYETNDSGNEWKPLPVGANVESSKGKYPLKIMYGRRNDEGIRCLYMLFARTYTPLRISTDEGRTWMQAQYTTPWGEKYLPFYGNAISLEHSDENVVFLGVGTVMKSTDGGQNFIARNTPGYSGANVEEIKFSNSGRIYLSVTDRGFYRSNGVYDGTAYPTFRHTRDQNYSEVGDIGIDPINENHIIYAEAADSFALRESFDGGLSWSKIEDTEASAAPQLIDFHNEDRNIIYSTYFSSKDGGRTWTANSQSICAVSGVDNDVVYSVSGKELYKSSNRGETFEHIYSADWDITYVLPDNTKSDAVYLGIKNGDVVKLANDQVFVMNSANGLSNVAPYAMAQNPNNINHIVLGGQRVDYSASNNIYLDNYCKAPGVYETFDGGITWHIVKGVPSMRIVYSLAFSPSTDEIFIGGYTGGLIVYDYAAYKKYLSAENSVDEDFTAVYNGETHKVTVRGKINNEKGVKAYSTLLVMPYEIMPRNAKSSDIAFLGQVQINEDGEFEYTFSMPLNCKYGVYNVYLGGSGVFLPGVGEYDNAEFSVFSFEFEETQSITAAARILNKTGEPKKIAMYLEQYINDGDADRLVDIKSERYTVAAESDVPITKRISSPLNKIADGYRAFLWADDSTLKPLTGCIENKMNGE